jgi:parallel beta-helix repeat protein
MLSIKTALSIATVLLMLNAFACVVSRNIAFSSGVRAQSDVVVSIVDADTLSGSKVILVNGSVPPGGLPFSVKVLLSGTIDNFVSYQVGATFDNNTVRCDSFSIPENDPSFVFYGRTVFNAHSIDNDGVHEGIPLVTGGSSLDNQNITTNGGVLCVMNFTALKEGWATISIYEDTYSPTNSYTFFMTLYGGIPVVVTPYTAEDFTVIIHKPRTIIVPDDAFTIQQAINNATEGDTVFVKSGTYYENVTVSKSISLIGESRESTIVHSNATVTVLVTASNSTVANFTVSNSGGVEVEDDHYGISVSHADNCNISRNSLTAGNNVGIGLGSSSYTSVIGNMFNKTGLVVGNSYHNTVINNTVNGQPIVYLEDNANQVIVGTGQVILVNCLNITVQNSQLTYTSIGVQLRSSNSCKIIDSNLTESYEGISIQRSSGNNITGNFVYQTIFGIVLFRTTNTAISDNLVNDNYEGMAIYTNSNLNVVTGNYIVNNQAGIDVFGTSNCSIDHNNFVNNTDQVISNLSYNFWDNGYAGGNYWSDLSASDVFRGLYQNETGSDGIADSPYVIDVNSSDIRTRQDSYPLMAPIGSTVTSAGENVTVIPTTNVGLVFDNVTQAGSTTVDLTAAGPAPPSNFKLEGQFFNITTTATFSDNITIRIVYDDTGMTQEEEDNLCLDHWNETTHQWENITTLRDTVNNVIYGQTSHLSAIGIHTILIHDIGMVNIVPWRTVVGQGYNIRMNLTVSNGGDFTESFHIAVYANPTLIGVIPVDNLSNRTSRVITFVWNSLGFPYGNFTLSSIAETVTNESHVSDNTYTCLTSIHVGIPGDVTSVTSGVYDQRVDTRDVTYLILLFQTKPDSSNWNPNADINDDGVVDTRDITTAILNFYKQE